jgi:hypothetical protein
MNKLYKLIVLFLTLTAMNTTIQAQEDRNSAIFSLSKASTQDIAFFNYPNPASTQTTVSYNLPVKAKVTLQVLDLTGRQLALLINAEQTAGKKEFYWDITKNRITSGMYILVLKIDNRTFSRKVVIE